MESENSNNSADITGESKTNLIINFLPLSLNQDHFQSLFTSIGAIKSCTLVKDSNTGHSLGYGFVDFVNPDDAERAIEILNEFKLENKTIKVSFARPSLEKYSKVYISGLPRSVTEQDLECLFSPFGEIVGSKVVHNQTINEFDNLPRGIGFIRFKNKYQAQRAISALNKTKLNDSNAIITVKLAHHQTNQPQVSAPPDLRNFISGPTTGFMSPMHQPPNRLRYTPIADNFIGNTLSSVNTSNNPGWCIFVYNIGPEVQQNTLWQLFSIYGAISNVKIIENKGFGFVTMYRYEEALLAIQTLNGFQLGGRVLQVSFKSNNSRDMKNNVTQIM